MLLLICFQQEQSKKETVDTEAIAGQGEYHFKGGRVQFVCHSVLLSVTSGSLPSVKKNKELRIEAGISKFSLESKKSQQIVFTAVFVCLFDSVSFLDKIKIDKLLLRPGKKYLTIPINVGNRWLTCLFDFKVKWRKFQQSVW